LEQGAYALRKSQLSSGVIKLLLTLDISHNNMQNVEQKIVAATQKNSFESPANGAVRTER
jgi:hypothetical protein